MIEEYNYSAENLLYHICSIIQGNVGFRLAKVKMQEIKNRESLDEPAVGYTRKVLDLLPNIRQ
jgi:hypothetical protein